ncbi:MAG: ribonuclease HI [Chloroflexota bacterium]
MDFDRAPLTASTAATVYCDGACQGNPGPGGYGALVRVSGHPERTLSDGKARTTNNEMELSGAAAGLRLAVSLGAKEITVVSDSEYLVKGMSGWVKGWLRNGWKTSKGEPVKNRALWEELHGLCQGRKVSWSWIRGHNGHAENERCDALAVAAAREAAGARGRQSR